jgi:hypothetical protein
VILERGLPSRGVIRRPLPLTVVKAGKSVVVKVVVSVGALRGNSTPFYFFVTTKAYTSQSADRTLFDTPIAQYD